MQLTTKKSSVLPLSIIASAVVVAGLTFLLPVASSVTNPIATHWRTAVGTAVMLMFIGAATVFWFGVKSFRARLRSAYRLIAFGIFSFSLALIQLLIWGLMNLWNSAWADSGSGLLPFLVASLLIYFGMRKFAGALGLHSRLMSARLVVPLTLAGGIVMGIAAHFWVQYNLAGTDTYIGVTSWCAGYFLCGSILAYKIYRSIGTFYRHAMKWLTIAVFAFFISAAHEAINTFWFNNGDVYTDYGFYLIPMLVTGALLVWASGAFHSLPALGGTDGPGDAKPEDATDRDYIDSLVAVASLVARPQEVDQSLDRLRLATAKVAAGESLDAHARQELVGAYQQLETYLFDRDVLRKYTPDQVRSYVTPAFLAVLLQPKS